MNHRCVYFTLIADTHIIDNLYVKGSENGVEDKESILLTTPRLTAARDLIDSLHPHIERVFLITRGTRTRGSILRIPMGRNIM